MHLVEQAALACPRAEGLEVFQTLLLRPDVTNLDHDQRVLVRGAGGKKHVCVKLPRCALHAVTEVPQKRGRRCAVEAASHGGCRQRSEISETNGREEDVLDQVPGKDGGYRIRARFETGCDAECRASAAQTPPEI